MVAPILNYASEIWGFEEWSKLETLHLKACKYALGVRSSTTTYFIFHIHIYLYFIFDLFREGSPSTKVVFQGALQ